MKSLLDLFPYLEVQKEFHKCIESLETHAIRPFSTSGQIHSPANPGLSINGIGPVGLPLSERDALDIIKVSRKASKTRSKQSDQTVWDLDSDQFDIRNPGWGRTLLTIKPQLSRWLSLRDDSALWSIQLDRLRLYGEGKVLDSQARFVIANSWKPSR